MKNRNYESKLGGVIIWIFILAVVLLKEPTGITIDTKQIDWIIESIKLNRWLIVLVTTSITIQHIVNFIKDE